MSLVRFLARPMLASSFVIAGLDKLKNADDTAKQLSPLLRRAAETLPFATDEKMLARVIGGTQVGAGALLALGKCSRISATLLAGISALNTFVEYRSADISTKEGRIARRSRLLKNLSLTGGVLLAAVDTAGRPSLAWRAEHLAMDAKKATGKQLKKTDRAVRKAVDHAVGA
ncbi:MULTISPECIES: DoxX family protein [Arthrobacter]|uniref:DoxX family protein n=1 Tax=Arthrobacter terricola TaxID=2547396 RepID=A0A4R5KPQ9_9MICC|nr:MULTISPECIES: DoxX family protein [Arthrobacter]MBT8161071.1 DoxX family protein [Arthrobacter sp. GN70]TDF96928.1 DoxX family protein [Arthrobacter terricola]